MNLAEWLTDHRWSNSPGSLVINNGVPVPAVFGWGEDSYWLKFGDQKITFRFNDTFILDHFVKKVKLKASSELVLSRDLHDTIDENCAEPNVACKRLRQIIYALNQRFCRLGGPPDNDNWIINEREQGYHLNESIQWEIDKSLGTRKSNSVWSEASAPETIENLNAQNRSQRRRGRINPTTNS